MKLDQKMEDLGASHAKLETLMQRQEELHMALTNSQQHLVGELESAHQQAELYESRFSWATCMEANNLQRNETTAELHQQQSQLQDSVINHQGDLARLHERNEACEKKVTRLEAAVENIAEKTKQRDAKHQEELQDVVQKCEHLQSGKPLVQGTKEDCDSLNCERFEVERLEERAAACAVSKLRGELERLVSIIGGDGKHQEHS
eukprot:gnl/MRDRNA2_/MRDRNA2_83496_c0_seq3.p1 gnl/MRDRNA2_/MRDRNA2_83496_c0~~gnl/MRDRNA2_/MRDRNA2_83496_c0_seq3.p1  ORF type:complete len:238 (+),score=64.09 gnl/MRDRNA2_/MRDRNA2_83496_c0_seq3:104-715(+)